MIRSQAGASAMEAPQPWSTLELTRGRFRLADVAAIVQGVRSVAGMQVMLIPAAVSRVRAMRFGAGRSL